MLSKVNSVVQSLSSSLSPMVRRMGRFLGGGGPSYKSPKLNQLSHTVYNHIHTQTHTHTHACIHAHGRVRAHTHTHTHQCSMRKHKEASNSGGLFTLEVLQLHTTIPLVPVGSHQEGCVLIMCVCACVHSNTQTRLHLGGDTPYQTHPLLKLYSTVE